MGYQSDEGRQLEILLSNFSPSEIIDKLTVSVTYDLIIRYAGKLNPKLVAALQTELKRRGYSDCSEFIGSSGRTTIDRITLQNGEVPTDAAVLKLKKLLAKELKELAKDLYKNG